MILNLNIIIFFITLKKIILKTFWKNFIKKTVLKIDNDKLV